MNREGRRTTATARLAGGLLFAGLWLGASSASARGEGPAERIRQGQTYILVVTGIGGESKFSGQFAKWGTSIVEAAQIRSMVPASNITYLTEDGARPATGTARKEAVEAALVDIARKATADDLVFIVLIGHGSYRGEESHINLPGPDMTAQDFAMLLKPVKARIAFANTTSASGEWAKVLSGPNRAIVTSTKSGMERNESVFGGYFAKALAEDGADTDKDGRVSLAEAFEFARAETARYYVSDNRLLTEHAQIEDTGDGEPVAAIGPGQPEGALAARMFMGAGAAGVVVPANASPELRALLTKKSRLEENIGALRARRDTMEESIYQTQLEALLLDLARTDSEIRRLSGGGA
jgi:hypothetical protein